MASGSEKFQQSVLPDDWMDFIETEFPSHRAAREGRIDILSTLIGSHYEVNELNHDRETPLHEACFNGHLKCVELLLDRGALIDARSIDGSTALCQASAMGRTECVRLLLQRNAQVNPPFVLFTPLHEAALRRNEAIGDQVDCAELLINAGAKLDVSDCDMGTPLHAACFRNSYRCERILLLAGACVNAVKNHRTGLHIAARNGFLESAQLLIDFGGNFYLQDNMGRRARQLAPEGGDVAQFLTTCETTPPSLMHLCRLVIHAAVRPRPLHVVCHLDIPVALTAFILCESFK